MSESSGTSQSRDPDLGRVADVVHAGDAGQTDAEEREGEPRHDHVGVQVHHPQAEYERCQRPHQDRGEQGHGQAARGVAHDQPGQRSDQHRALDPEVVHADGLLEELAGRRYQDRRRGQDRRPERDEDQIPVN